MERVRDCDDLVSNTVGIFNSEGLWSPGDYEELDVELPKEVDLLYLLYLLSPSSFKLHSSRNSTARRACAKTEASCR